MKTFNPDLVVKVYLEEKTVRKTAKRLNCSIGTVSLYLKKANFSTESFRNKSKGRDIPPNHHGKLVKWIRENKHIQLPLKVKEVMSLTGCTKDEVKSYFYRIKKKLQKRLEDYLKTKPEIFLTDIDKRRFPFKAVKDFKVELGKDFHFNLYLTLFTEQKKKIVLSLKDVERMVKKVK